MSAPAIAHDQGKRHFSHGEIFVASALVVTIYFFGTVFPAVLWGLWHLFGFGPGDPTFMNYSRFRLDVIFGGPYALALVAYIMALFIVPTNVDPTSRKFNLLGFLCTFLFVDLLAAIATSAVVGLVLIAVPAIIVFVGYFMYEAVMLGKMIARSVRLGRGITNKSEEESE